MYKHLQRALLRLLIGICALSGMSCAGDLFVPDPSQESRPRVAVSVGVGGAMETYEISGMSSSNDSLKISLSGELDSLATWAIVRAKISGQGIARYTNATANPPWTSPGDIWRTFDGGGVWVGGCRLNLVLQYTSSALEWCNYGGVPLQTERWTKVKGKGVLYWNANRIEYGSTCGPQGTPCYDVEGEFQVEIEVPPVQFTVTASHKVITSNTLVTFSASVSPGTIGGLTVPFQVKTTGWRWVPDSGTATVACASYPPYTNPATCQYTVTTSGYMYVDAEVQGQNVTEAVYVSKVPCLTGDSLLDDSRIRRALRDALAGSNPNGPPDQRTERWGGRFLRPDGSQVDTLFNPPPGAGPCGSPVPSLSGLIPLITWHTHPFTPGSSTDTLPRSQSVCPSDTTYTPPTNQPRRLRPGPSRGAGTPSNGKDFTANAGYPFIVVDKENVYVVGPYDPSKPKTWKQKTYKRSKCDPLAVN